MRQHWYCGAPWHKNGLLVIRASGGPLEYRYSRSMQSLSCVGALLTVPCASERVYGVLVSIPLGSSLEPCLPSNCASSQRNNNCVACQDEAGGVTRAKLGAAQGDKTADPIHLIDDQKQHSTSSPRPIYSTARLQTTPSLQTPSSWTSPTPCQ